MLLKTTPATYETAIDAWRTAEFALVEARAQAALLQRSSDRHVKALEFYARPENWRDGAGTGPRRAPVCVSDAGQIARQALDPSGMDVGSAVP